MKYYNIIEGYFNWVLRRDNETIDSTKLTDFIKISDSNRYLEWTDVVKKLKGEYPFSFENYYYYKKKDVKLKNIIEIENNFYSGNFIYEDGKTKKVQIEVKIIDLLEFLYHDKSSEGHNHTSYEDGRY